MNCSYRCKHGEMPFKYLIYIVPVSSDDREGLLRYLTLYLELFIWDIFLFLYASHVSNM